MQVLAGYSMGEMISTGRRSVVFRATRLHDGARVVVKAHTQPRPDLEEVARFEQENRLLEKAAGEGIVRSLGMVREGGRPVIVMEDFGGESLSRLQVAGRLELRELLSLRVRLSQSLAEVHAEPLVQAFGELARQLLASGAEELSAWKERLFARLGQTVPVMVAVLPELELVLGPQAPPRELPANEAQNRFNFALSRFVEAAATAEQPLVVFLDDLQWADPGSLRLLELLLCSADLGHVLVLGAFRSEEVGEWHPLEAVVDRVRRAGVRVTRVVLGPLPRGAVEALLTDTLDGAGGRAGELADLCLEKTAGNPYFLTQFLCAMHERGALALDPVERRWRWDREAVSAMEVTENVVSLVSERLGRLTPATREVLEVAALCGGRGFGVPLVAGVLGRDERETMAQVSEAAAAGLIQRTGGVDPLLSGISRSGSTVAPRAFRFVHDRVRGAALAALSEHRRRELHLAIGRRLAAAGSPRGQEIFDVTAHLNEGRELLSDPEERLQVARLDLEAARLARGSLAIGTALGLLRCGVSLLPPDAWDLQHALAHDLHLLASECAQLDGDFDAMAAFGDPVVRHARDRVEAAEAQEVRVAWYEASRQLVEAVDAGLEALAWGSASRATRAWRTSCWASCVFAGVRAASRPRGWPASPP